MAVAYSSKHQKGSDLQFSIDSTKLISVFKGRNKPTTTLAHISVFDVDETGEVAATATDNRVDPIQIPFGFAFNGNNPEQFYITEASFGGVLVSLDYATNKVSALEVVNSTSFAASCWAVWSSITDTYYDINSVTPSVGKIDSTGMLEGFIKYDKSLEGGFDAVLDGEKLYMLTGPANVIIVINVRTGKVLQKFEYGTMEDRPFWTGMAMYPANPLLSGGMA
ncbi:uncharacterized protein LTR77_001515 [Saxophila tyrrhenica]|uniref:Uncharacterized protein n=1 Tax=Saxophila tyrrhenica TaxID=1690608 RepID=A0AAV9PL11_9PEZI|nr:hypothetical protein LTR77_001515 [Saxophila tyrrhenica]